MSTKDITDKQVVEAYRDSIEKRNMTQQSCWPEDILHERTGEHVKVCLRAMERAERRGLIEYGVSLRSGWMTDAGVKLCMPTN